MKTPELIYPDYLILEDNKVVDSHLNALCHFDNGTLTCQRGGKHEIHVIIKAACDTTFSYVFENRCEADIIETRLLSQDVTLTHHVDAKEDALIHLFIDNQTDHQNNIHVDDQGTLQANAQVTLGYAELGDGDIDASFLYELKGQGASMQLRMAALAKDEEKKNYTVHIRHLSPDTTGIMDNYGVSKDQGSLVIDGIGTIVKGMHGSASHQTNKIMVFDEGCYASANPYLFIDDYDVQASHAAGVGKMDEEHLYYLESRGLSKRASMQLITYGYLRPVIDVIDNKMLKDQFETVLSKVGA